MSHLRAPAARADRREGGRHGRPAPRTAPAPAETPIRPQLLRLAVLPPTAVALSACAVVLFTVRSSGVRLGPTLWAVLAGGVAVTGVGLVIAAVAADRAARSVSDRVAALRRSSARGEAELLGVVETLRRGEAPPTRRSRGGPPADADDFELLAADLSRAHDGAVTAVVQAAQLSSQTGSEQKLEVFVNLARRLQSLVHREISILDELENEIEDPDLLKGLFHVDHLATRIRRHAENLAVLGGAVSRRQWSNPVSMTEVLRSAIAEVEQYSRVKLVPPVDGELRGHAVADVIHLLAELVENATVFSAPHTQVLLRANLVTSGLAVEVEDRGLGMPAEETGRMNALLADPDQVNVGRLLADGRIGLFVVSQLARRHGIRVRLQNNIYGGVQAVLVVPQALLGSAPGLPAGVSRGPDTDGAGLPLAPAPGPLAAAPGRPTLPPAPRHPASGAGAPATLGGGRGPDPARRPRARHAGADRHPAPAHRSPGDPTAPVGPRRAGDTDGAGRPSDTASVRATPTPTPTPTPTQARAQDGSDGAGRSFAVGQVPPPASSGHTGGHPTPSGPSTASGPFGGSPGAGDAADARPSSVPSSVPSSLPSPGSAAGPAEVRPDVPPRRNGASAGAPALPSRTHGRQGPAEPGAQPSGAQGANSGPPAPLPVRGAREARPNPAEATPGIRHGDRPVVEEHAGLAPTPRVGPVRGTMGKPRLPRRRAQEHIVPQLRGGPVPRPDCEQPAGHDPGLMAAFQRGFGLAEAQQSLEADAGQASPHPAPDDRDPLGPVRPPSPSFPSPSSPSSSWSPEPASSLPSDLPDPSGAAGTAGRAPHAGAAVPGHGLPGGHEAPARVPEGVRLLPPLSPSADDGPSHPAGISVPRPAHAVAPPEAYGARGGPGRTGPDRTTARHDGSTPAG
ncbi:ATP-binding protein [Streptomyces hilarionis]|uniref:ATP-binding protein n=1 Tax=Streptomyces hilarionis TaxID=2839954 RepID=UPI00211A29C1|nr:ATP-binding protein [Streptomyces hilarionis]MCQ9130679.1 ATP-binding protein [Streptomyces hilarionis]